MAEIVNLRRARKAKARDDARRAGDENAAKHGRSGGEKARDAAERAAEIRRLDGHRREREGDGDAGPEDGAGPRAEE